MGLPYRGRALKTDSDLSGVLIQKKDPPTESNILGAFHTDIYWEIQPEYQILPSNLWHILSLKLAPLLCRSRYLRLSNVPPKTSSSSSSYSSPPPAPPPPLILILLLFPHSLSCFIPFPEVCGTVQGSGRFICICMMRYKKADKAQGWYSLIYFRQRRTVDLNIFPKQRDIVSEKHGTLSTYQLIRGSLLIECMCSF